MGITQGSSEELRKYGLRIYTTIKNGPLDKGGAQELTDFIMPPEEVLSYQINFDDWLHSHANKEIKLSLYSLLTKQFRDITITTNPIGNKDGILGASVKKENWTIAHKNILHIVNVFQNSFAHKQLGLIPLEDYIVGVKTKGCPIVPLNQEEKNPLQVLGEEINNNKGKLMKFYIYNTNKGVRDVTVTIGNDDYFSLGCEGAYGALHVFPSLAGHHENLDKNDINENQEGKKDPEKEVIKNEVKEVNEMINDKDKQKEGNEILEQKDIIINQTNEKKDEKIEENINEVDKKEEVKIPQENINKAAEENKLKEEALVHEKDNQKEELENNEEKNVQKEEEGNKLMDKKDSEEKKEEEKNKIEETKLEESKKKEEGKEEEKKGELNEEEKLEEIFNVNKEENTEKVEDIFKINKEENKEKIENNNVKENIFQNEEDKKNEEDKEENNEENKNNQVESNKNKKRRKRHKK